MFNEATFRDQLLLKISVLYLDTRFFYKQHFNKQRQTDIGKKISKS